ncbi:gelation factor-like [Amphiura filiformis]|uniref:gelation factor-like n=1 Tax=Amphiura filiformis TaxID=82378 RepID=UPI003B210239
MIIGGTKVEATQGGNSLHVQDNNDGTYMIDYDSCKGSQPMYVKINGTKMKGSPYNTLPEVDPHQCTIQLGLPGNPYDAGGLCRKDNMIANVQTIDANGDKMTFGNAKVEATQDGDALDVQDNNNGTYTIRYDSCKGSQPMYVKINGTEMKGSPYNTLPEVDPHQCTIQGLPGDRLSKQYRAGGICMGMELMTATVQKETMIATIQTVDVNGHDMTIGNAKVEATQDGDSLDVQDNNNGKYTIDYNSCKGSQPMHIKINGTEMEGSPYNTLPEVDPHQCTIQLGLPGGRYDAGGFTERFTRSLMFKL